MSLWDNVKKFASPTQTTITMITARMTITSMIMKNPRSLLPPAAAPAVLSDKQEDKLRRAEVDAAREEVTREIEGSDAQPQPPAYQYPPITRPPQSWRYVEEELWSD